MEKETKLLLTDAIEKMRANGAPVIVGGTHTLTQAYSGKTSNVHLITSSNGALSAFEKNSNHLFEVAKLEYKRGISAEDKAKSELTNFANLANKEIKNFDEACDCKYALVLSTPEINPATGKKVSGRTVSILASDDFDAIMDHVHSQVYSTALVNHADVPADRTALVNYSCVIDGKIAATNLTAEAFHPALDFSKNRLNIDLIGHTIKTVMHNAHDEYSLEQ